MYIAKTENKYIKIQLREILDCIDILTNVGKACIFDYAEKNYTLPF